MRALVDEAYERTRQLLRDQKDNVEALAQALLEKEVLQIEDLNKILGPRPFQSGEQTNLERLTQGGSDYLGSDQKEDQPADEGEADGPAGGASPEPALAAAAATTGGQTPRS